MSHITIPATGSGDATPQVATDLIAGIHFQQIKLVDGTVGGSQPAVVDANGNLHVAIASTVTGVYIGASVANLPATQSVQGYVGASIANLPGTQPVSGNVTASVIGYVGASLTGPITASVIGYVGVSTVPGYQGSVTGYVGASLAGPVTASVIGYVGASVTGGQITASTIGYVGASITNFPATQSIQGYVGASVANLPAVQSVSLASTNVTQTVSGNVTASVVGYVGASITNAGALSAASQVLVGGSTTVFVASQPAQVLVGYVGASIAGGFTGASISNVPQVAIASYSVTQPITVASTSVTQPVSGNVTASVVGYVGASVPPTNIGSAISYVAAADIPGLGASPYQYITGASFNNVNVKTAAGTLYNVTVMNVNSAARYLRLYDKASQPSPSVDIPRQTYVVPGNTSGAGAVIPMPVGLLFAAGIGFAITGGSMGTTDTTATGLGDVVLNLGYS